MYRKLSALLVFSALLVVTALWAAPRDTQATAWSPFFGPPSFYRLSPNAVGANGDTLSNFNVFAPSANFTALFGGAITFGDPRVFTASGADIPGVGSFIGTLDSVAALGLVN